MDGVEVVKHRPSSEDERGRIVKYVFGEPVEEVVVVERRKGTVSGNHYHKGLDISKNPEKLIILSGKAGFEAKNLLTGGELKKTVGPLTEIRIHPHVWHRLEALEDCIFMEANKRSGIEGDLFRIHEG